MTLKIQCFQTFMYHYFLLKGMSMGHGSGASRFSDAEPFSGGRVVRDALCDS